MPFQVLTKEQGALFLPSFPGSTLTLILRQGCGELQSGQMIDLTYGFGSKLQGKRQPERLVWAAWAPHSLHLALAVSLEGMQVWKRAACQPACRPQGGTRVCYCSWHIICVALVSCSARCFYSEVKLLFLVGNRDDQPATAGQRTIINWVKLLLQTAMLVDLLGEINFSKCGQTKGLMKKNDGMISRVTGFPVSNSLRVWDIKGKKSFRRWRHVKKRILLLLNHKNLLMKLYRNSC